MTYRRTDFVVSSLYFLFTNQYSLGKGFRFQECWCVSINYICVTLLSNLIYLAFRELVSLCVGCLTACLRDLHHLVSKLDSINQVISFYFLFFCLYLPRQFFFVLSLFRVWSCFKSISVRLSSSYVILD
jgi:hypothetical protein